MVVGLDYGLEWTSVYLATFMIILRWGLRTRNASQGQGEKNGFPVVSFNQPKECALKTSFAPNETVTFLLEPSKTVGGRVTEVPVYMIHQVKFIRLPVWLIFCVHGS